MALFPLPLAPFEFYYLTDDRPEYPTAFPAVLRFQGPVDREAFNAAFDLTLSRHPLLSALIVDGPRGWPEWTPASPPQLNWVAGDAARATLGALPPPCRPFDLRREPGLRAAAYNADGVTELRMEVHHAACDGIGAQILVRDLLLAYDHLAAGRPGAPRLPPLDPQRLVVRDEFGMADYRATLRDVWNMLALWGRWLFRPAAEVVSPRGVRSAAVDEPDPYVAAELSAQDTSALSARAKAQGATVNDLVLRDLFLTLHDWNVRHGGADRRQLRVLVPTNLRLEADATMPAANVLGFAFLSRSARQLRDPSELLRNLHEEMAAIKRWRLGLYFVAGVRIACRWPALLGWSLRRRHAFATAVFSNMAAVFHDLGLRQRDGRAIVGDAELVWMSSAPPIRPGTRVALATVTYAGALNLHLRGDVRYLSRGDVQQLLDALVTRLRTAG